jgi:hypothetical protein
MTKRLDVWFLLLASICLVFGVSLGITMGILHDFSLAPVHAHLNLVGWASLALFGLTYRAWPEMAASRLARIHFALAAPAAVLFPFGVYLAVAHGFPLVAILAAFAWLAGVALFVTGLARTAFAGGERRQAVAGAAAAMAAE